MRYGERLCDDRGLSSHRPKWSSMSKKKCRHPKDLEWIKLKKLWRGELRRTGIGVPWARKNIDIQKILQGLSWESYEEVGYGEHLWRTVPSLHNSLNLKTLQDLWDVYILKGLSWGNYEDRGLSSHRRRETGVPWTWRSVDVPSWKPRK